MRYLTLTKNCVLSKLTLNWIWGNPSHCTCPRGFTIKANSVVHSKSVSMPLMSWQQSWQLMDDCGCTVEKPSNSNFSWVPGLGDSQPSGEIGSIYLKNKRQWRMNSGKTGWWHHCKFTSSEKQESLGKYCQGGHWEWVPGTELPVLLPKLHRGIPFLPFFGCPSCSGILLTLLHELAT